MNIGKSILNIRKSHGMTQEQFGGIFHVTRQTVSNWENEKSYPDLQTLIKISEKFMIPLDTLIKEDENMVQSIDKERHLARRARRVIFCLAVFILCAAAGVWMFFCSFEPTPDKKRNISTAAVRMYLNLPGATPSRAIIRTFNTKEYEQFSESKIKQIRHEIGGKMEGDIPALHLNSGQKIRPVLQNNYSENIEPDDIPVIIIKEYSDTVVLPENDILYEGNVKTKKSVLQQDSEGYYFCVNEDFRDSDGPVSKVCMIEVRYSVEGKNYISLSAVYVSSE
ncbi:helix-turn-helix domain-containing protein [Clostridium transplantifaecale]|uniref:helix-turn-helix domain-containing protein n=1 Tax=Clostridium transplantifaecale TaxID=2479838 RepID=UPI000F64059F|nr:helix-turn-helix transcriptional regulator [Clostridium transplantifaecale]